MISRLRIGWVLAMLMLAHPVYSDTIPIDDFRELGGWSVNADGGVIEITPDSENTTGPNPSMRLIFRHGKDDYGNAARAIKMPRNATGVEFDLYVRRNLPGAGLSVWFFEPDGDGHHAWVKPEGKSFPELEPGWHQCFVPITSFRFDPRGNGKNELLAANKILIGINSGAGDVSVANLAFRTVDKPSRSEATPLAKPRIENGARSRVAIFHHSFEPRSGDSNPEVLASVLRKGGYGVTLLGAAHLADSAILTSETFDCLVLPYGPRYPHEATGSIQAFMKSGGSIFTTGGYAFDEPSITEPGGRAVAEGDVITAEDVAGGKGGPTYMNTRRGKPEARMTSGTLTHMWPDQVPLFDPCYHLRDAARMVSSPGQQVTVGIDIADARVQGYAACSMLGSNDPVFPDKFGRHIPLVDVLDAHGRSVGGAGAMAHVYAGPFAGSSWAFFGVTSTDLFAEGSPLLARLPAIIEAITRKTFIHSLGSDLACYRDGETVKLSCKAANSGRNGALVSVRFRVYDRRGAAIWQSPSTRLSLRAGATETVSAEFRPERFTDDLYRVVAEMTIAGSVVDSMETGFAAYQPEVIAAGIDLRLKNNYFHDGDRPVLLSGTNVTGSVFYSGNENPLVWDHDFARMRECGVNIVRVLHFSPFLSDKPSFSAIKPIDLNVDRLPLKTERKLDAFVQLCQKHKVVMFLTLHDWMTADLSDEELAAQRKFARLIAGRYRDVPGFMLDVENEPMLPLPFQARPDEKPHVVAAWNDFLKAKYGTDEALREAWAVSPPEGPIGSIPYRAGTPAWEDVRTYDADFFRNHLASKWIKANSAGVKEGDPRTPMTVGFLQEYYALNKIACMEGQDFANTHSYNTPDVLRCDLKLLDRRFEGRSLTLGEFGSVRDYQVRTGGQDSPYQDHPRYVVTGHYLFGLGGSFLANWCWKDADDVLFPWGVNYAAAGPPKDTLKAYRNQSLLMRQVRPVYHSPEVFLVLPVDQMTGEQRTKMVPTYYQVVETLLGARVQFGTIDDRSLAKLPASAKLLIYPAPFAVPDDAYERLKSFVRKGGTLCVTADISYDHLRKRTRTERLSELLGVRFVSENYPNIGWGGDGAPCINVELVGASLVDGVYVNKIGAGEVRFSPRPMGNTEKQGEYIYSRPIAGLEGATVDAQGVHAFRIPESDGGRTIILVNPHASEKSVQVREQGCEAVDVVLQASGVGMVRFNRKGTAVAVESQGPATLGDFRIPMKGHWALVACDGRGLAESREVAAIPFGEGEVDLSPLAVARNAVVQAGEVAGGGWKPLSESTDSSITAAGDTAFDIRIVTAKERLAEFGRFIASEMMLGEQ